MTEPGAVTAEKRTAAYRLPLRSIKSFFYTAELSSGEAGVVCVKIPRTKEPDYDVLFTQCVPPSFREN